MDRLGHKIVALFTIMVTIFVSTALPIKLSEWFRRKGRIGRAIISAVMCFGGGFFLGTFLLHSTPEVEAHITKHITRPNNIHYPLAYLIIGAGFFMMLFLEKAVMELLQWNDRRKEKSSIVLDVEAEGSSSKQLPSLVALRQTGETNGVVVGGDLHKEKNGKPLVAEDLDGIGHINPSGEVLSEGHGHSHSAEGGHSHVTGSATKSIVLMVALSLDCIFEGLSLGLQETVTGVWQMVVAILSHEIVVAFSLGLQLIQHNTPLRTLFMAFVYGITCPAGIAVGVGIYEGAVNLAAFPVVHGVLSGLTAGVFLYVTFFEILMHEFISGAKMVNILAVVLGFGIMAAIMTSHGHAHHDDHHAYAENQGE